MKTTAFFLTGTGTNIGKTFVGGALLKDILFTYWKPIQTGAAEPGDDDTAVAWQTAKRPPLIVPPLATYALPASPDQAAAAEGRAAPTVAHLCQALSAARSAGKEASAASNILIVEGAGGVLVPLNDAGETWSDFLATTRLPALVVASTALGTLNHTSLTIEHLRRRGLPLLGVVLSGPRQPANEASLRRQYPDVAFFAFPGDDAAELAAFVKEALLEHDRQADPQAWLAFDRAHVWHPYTQHQTAPEPLAFVRAQGVYLYTASGERLIDGASSWWVNTIGHGRPEIAAAIAAQQQTLDHVIFAGATHAPAARVAHTLARLTDGVLPRVFFSDNGSTAVEIALKIAYQRWVHRGEPQRTRFVSFRGSYHGDTFGAMSVAQSQTFHGTFRPLLFETIAADLPQKDAETDDFLARLALVLDAEPQRLAGLLVEPLLQGAGGMRLHPAAFLRGAAALCRERGLPLILDEVFTGLGRLGAAFAFQRAGVAPDIICIAKGLTGGNLPLAATLAREEYFAEFLGPDKGRALLHGHSYTGNAIACAAAVAALGIFQAENLAGRARAMEARFQAWITQHGESLKLGDARAIGGVLAFELPGSGANDYHDHRAGLVPDAARQHGLFLRPLGNTVYLMPPLTITPQELDEALQALVRMVRDIA